MTRSAPAGHRGVGQAPGVGVEHGHDRQDRGRARATPRLSAVSTPIVCRKRRAVGVDARPWGCRWCRSCSTSTPPGSRRRRRTRPGAAAASSVLVVVQRATAVGGSGTSPLPSSITTMWRTVLKVGSSGHSRPSSDRSTKITSSSAWLTMYVSCSGNSRMLSVCSTRPVHGRGEVQLEVAGGVPGEGGRPGRRREMPRSSSTPPRRRVRSAHSP